MIRALWKRYKGGTMNKLAAAYRYIK